MGLALNRSKETGRQTAAAICREIELDEGEAPEWVQLMPLGPNVMGRDGRSWSMSDPEAVVAASELPLVGDAEHSTELRARFGEEAPAKAWAEELRVEDGSGERAAGIWARVAWTPAGAYAAKNLEYRFVSPVFLYETETHEITRLTSWALTNRPNLKMTALNREDERVENEGKETAMNEEQRKALCKKLGLPEDATVEQITARASEAEEARNAQVQSQTVPRSDYEAALQRAESAEQRLATMVPKADLDAANQRATNAEQKLEEQETKARNDRAKAVLDKAQKEGKFPPASREFYASLCTLKEGIDKVEAELEKRPSLVTPDETRTEAAAANQAGDPSKRPLTATEKAVCQQMGLTEDEFRAAAAEVDGRAPQPSKEA